MGLIEIAAGRAGDRWEIRRLATLMLEHQMLKISSADTDEFDFLLVQINLKASPGPCVNLHDRVLKEGYSTLDTRGFIDELRRRLERLNRVHKQIDDGVSKNGLLDFIKLARRDCKLTLARYLFEPDEVAREILRQVRVTHGLIDINDLQFACVEAEAARAFHKMPQFEARILECLSEGSQVYWVADSTSSEINSLVEYPLTTVVLVIKPPGSSIEFEIKRAGRRGPHPLSAVHSRAGCEVPPSHRFDGGSTQWMIRYENNMASKLSSIYRLAHGVEAPVSRFISRSSIYNVPVNGDERSILDYFTDERIFGEGFDGMRTAMRQAIESFDAENQSEVNEIPGDFGQTMRFFTHIRPTQTILSGTSSFRLDKLAEYLSSDGPDIYFKKGLEIEHSNLDGRQLADELLEEVLCVYCPPARRYRSYRQYIDAAFAVERNREQADRNFLSVLGQIGNFYGTLLAIRANSSGESFVARNVGLRSVWEQGKWQIRVIFMDHDNVSIADSERENFQSLGAHTGTALDEFYIWGSWNGQKLITGSVDLLETIYRVNKEVFKQGESEFHKQMEAAYRKTHLAMKADPEFHEFFHPAFIKQINDWDHIVREYLKVKNASADIELWKEAMIEMFASQGREKNTILEHVIAAEKYWHFLEKYGFLY